jgi:ribonucrease Y
MLEELLVSGSFAMVGVVVGFLIARKISFSQFDHYETTAKAKANAIESEAHILLSRAVERSESIEKEAVRKYEEAYNRAKSDLSVQESALHQMKSDFESFRTSETASIDHARNTLENGKLNFSRNEQALEKLKEEYLAKMGQISALLEERSGLSSNEAKVLLMDQVRERFRNELGRLTRELEDQTKEQIKRKSDRILAIATSRYAGEFAAERLISVIHLESDELKGRIIGKEGRNIKAIEMITGVDIIIDETPNTIIVSSFNLYRRAIATKTIQLLVEDGRIQPSRIEEVYQKVSDEFEEAILREGEEIVFDLGLGMMHPELLRLVGRLRYRASYGQNALAHTLEVAHLAGLMAAEMGGDIRLAKRAGLLHDIGKSLTQEGNGSNHVDLGAEVCRRLGEDPVVINAIYAHHAQEEIKSIESACVCAADALSAARPGARREVLENFVRRVSEIEEIATQKYGVKQAYAINAGREVRVIVNAQSINDDESALLAREIADEIAQKVQFPGEIKVNVIRESRTIEYAK